MATVKELAQYLGWSGLYHVRGMGVAVKVVDARVSFGQVQLEIEPYGGTGSAWVAQDSVQIPEEAKYTISGLFAATSRSREGQIYEHERKIT